MSHSPVDSLWVITSRSVPTGNGCAKPQCNCQKFHVDRATTSQGLCWVRRFSEQDVALIFSLLSTAGFQLRSDDPAAMKVGKMPFYGVPRTQLALVNLHHAWQSGAMHLYWQRTTGKKAPVEAACRRCGQLLGLSNHVTEQAMSAS